MHDVLESLRIRYEQSTFLLTRCDPISGQRNGKRERRTHTEDAIDTDNIPIQLLILEVGHTSLALEQLAEVT